MVFALHADSSDGASVSALPIHLWVSVYVGSRRKSGA